MKKLALCLGLISSLSLSAQPETSPAAVKRTRCPFKCCMRSTKGKILCGAAAVGGAVTVMYLVRALLNNIHNERALRAALVAQQQKFNAQSGLAQQAIKNSRYTYGPLGETVVQGDMELADLLKNLDGDARCCLVKALDMILNPISRFAVNPVNNYAVTPVAKLAGKAAASASTLVNNYAVQPAGKLVHVAGATVAKYVPGMGK